ncbi:hypothetical protein [Nocardia sp. NPDC050406]|uniref:hypothetical protein n=1 Tax=Nocardia sp. NPDC050406 TaxID=3364318 RepID=UPI0037884AD0
MRYRPTALGYLRSDVSGISQAWDENQIRSTAKRLGYDLAKIVVARGDQAPLAGLKRLLAQVDAEAVVVPGRQHFEGEQVPEDLVRAADVITVNPAHTHARWVVPPLSADGM